MPTDHRDRRNLGPAADPAAGFQRFQNEPGHQMAGLMVVLVEGGDDERVRVKSRLLALVSQPSTSHIIPA